MVIKVYLSTCSGNMEIKRKQDFVTSLLASRKIPFQEIDITDASHEDDKKFMRENAKPTGNNPLPLPPQIFEDNTYLGDYESFHEANENDELYDFLKISQPQPAVTVKPAVSSTYQWDRQDGGEDKDHYSAVPEQHHEIHAIHDEEHENNHHGNLSKDIGEEENNKGEDGHHGDQDED